MSELSSEDVAILARAADLRLEADDLMDVTHRLNMLLSRLKQFQYTGLEGFDPVPFFALEEDANGR